MKKNVSINISGIIFYIEEDGYDRLKEYLDSINRYFTKFDDSAEIISDIESRIAEIFLAKLKDGRQVIVAEDVESLIATMGSIADFKAVEEPEETYEDRKTEQESSGPAPEEKRLFRDKKKKVLGGVAAGIGQYFQLDPLWIRLGFLVFFIIFFFEFEISLAIGAIYILLWIIIPGSDELNYEKKYKKMYRNPDDKVLGGVASGLAAYFGADVVIIRLLFVIFIFIGFSGLIAYIVFWIVLPEAKSLTDKMEMQGEPVTLSNIEANIKKSFNMKEGEETTFVKILLFPFRLIATILNSLSKGFGPLLRFLVEALRIVAGVAISATGVVSLLILIITAGVTIGVFAGGDYYFMDGFPLHIVRNSVPAAATVALFVALFVPFLFLAILGLMIIIKRNMMPQTAGWSLFALWVAAAIVLAISIPRQISNFAREAERETVEYFDMGEAAVLLTLRESDYDNDFELVTLRLRGHEGSDFRLVKSFEATGKNRDDAYLNTQMVEHQVVRQDSALIFDPYISFRDDAVFRMQHVSMTLYIPYNHPFRMAPQLSEILRNTLYQEGYSAYEMRNNTWIFTPEGLQCVTCQAREEWDDDPPRRQDSVRENSTAPAAAGAYSADRTFAFSDFNALDIGGAYIVEIVPGQDFRVDAYGDRKGLNSIEISQESGLLRIRTGKEDLIGKSEVKLVIGMPDIQLLDLHGGTKTYIRNLESGEIDIKLAGAASADVELTAGSIDIEMSGSTKLNLSGRAETIEAELSGIAAMDGLQCRAGEVNIRTSAAAKAQLFVQDYLNAEANGGSSIRYKGDPRVTSRKDFAGSVARID